jgi:hypothetical protein
MDRGLRGRAPSPSSELRGCHRGSQRADRGLRWREGSCGGFVFLARTPASSRARRPKATSAGRPAPIARPAAEWASVARAAAETCLQSFEASLPDTIEALPGADHDRRLETLARRLAGVSSATELESCLRPLAQALNAEEVRLVAPPHHGVLATQLLADDPSADPVTAAALRAQGFSSRLALPIADRGRTVAYLEAYCHQLRPWTRFDIGRARIITYQLGPLLSRGDVALTR